ncbi:unnamed protein product [Prunus armeniaca]
MRSRACFRRSSYAGAVELLEAPLFPGMVDTSIAGMEDTSVASFVCMVGSEECLD